MSAQSGRNSAGFDPGWPQMGPVHPHAPPCATGLLSRTLPGEYLAMLLAVHAGFVALAWGWYSPDVWMSLPLIAGAAWAIARLVGFLSGWLVTPLITLSVMGATLVVDGVEASDSPEWLVSGPFSAFALACILGAVFTLEVIGLTESRSRQFASFVRRHGVRILTYGIVATIAIYTFAVPLVQELIFTLNPPDHPHFALDRLTLPQSMLFKFVESFTGLMFLVVGMVVGSYLNVVIYRVPRGISTLVKSSHCPGCGADIVARDNLPLVGWLRLNGRCRNCDTNIPVRYPIVEGVIGLAFLLLFFVELISGGANLPVRRPNSYTGVQWILFYTKWDLVGYYVYHCFLFCTLFAWAMIRRDGHRVPLKTFAVVFAISMGAPLLLPDLLPWPFNTGAEFPVEYTVRNAAISSALGVLAGAAVSTLPEILGWFRQDSRPPSPLFDRPSWLVIGAGLGWQAVVGVLALLAIWIFACALVDSPGRTAQEGPQSNAPVNHPPPIVTELRSMALPAALLIHLCLWRHVAGLVA